MLDGRQCGILYFSKRCIHEMEVPLLISAILCTILSIVVCGDTINMQTIKPKHLSADHLSDLIRAKLDRSIVILGLQGAGKSRLGRMMAKALNLPFYDCDSEIEQSAGRPVHEIKNQIGDVAFRQAEARVLSRLMALGVCVIAVGEEIALSPSSMQHIFEKAVPIRVYADDHVMFDRLSRAATRPELVGTDIHALIAEHKKLYDPIYKNIPLSVHSHEGPAVDVMTAALQVLFNHLEVN